MEVTSASLAVSIIVALGTTSSFVDGAGNWKQRFLKCETSLADVETQLAQCNEKEKVKECPLGFMKNEKLGSCYNFVTRQKMVWIHALAYCTAQGANLVAIETQEELTFIQQEILRRGLPASPQSSSDFFYTGGTSINGAWQWLGGTSGPTKPMEFAPWEGGQGATDGDLCHTLSHPSYLWGDTGCTRSYATNFICEIKLS